MEDHVHSIRDSFLLKLDLLSQRSIVRASDGSHARLVADGQLRRHRHEAPVVLLPAFPDARAPATEGEPAH